MEVERDAVAQVHRGGCAALAEELTKGKAWFRVDVAFPCAAPSGFEAEGGAPQQARNPNGVAGSCAVAPERLASRYGSAYCYVARKDIGVREVATGEDCSGAFGGGGERSKKGPYPVVGGPTRDGQRNQGETGCASHCRDVAEASRDRDSAYFGGSMAPATEMNVFEEKV